MIKFSTGARSDVWFYGQRPLRLPGVLLIFIFATRVAFAQDSVKTAFDTDHEFDAGSRITLQALTPVHVENLATLGKVWGFLKYHHPLVTSGQRHWDYDLLRITPAVLAAPDRAAANSAIHRWIASLGQVVDCSPCASLMPQDLYMRPALAWIDDTSLLSAELSADLRSIYLNRPSSGTQFYLTQQKGVGNPVFDHEPDYKSLVFPDAGFRLLALFRIWNMVEYWAPYRDQIGESWDGVLRESIGTVGLAKDRASYQLEMMAVIARIRDTHANLWNALAVRPPVGACYLPVHIRFLQHRAVVTGFSDEQAGKSSGLKVGDIIEAFDDVPVGKLIQSWAPYYAASNEPTRLRDIAQRMGRGACGATRLRVRRENGEQEISASRVPAWNPRVPVTHDRPGDTFQLLADDVAYLKLSSIKKADIPRYLESAAATRGLIIDIRNYPSEFVVFALGQHLIDHPTAFARFTTGELSNPGAFRWGPPAMLAPKQPHYAGKVVILIDEVSQSQSEYTTMAFRTAPRATVIGSTTAGADGNISPIPLPGGLASMISGIGVFYPDKRPTQRVGIVPDIEVRPTIEGIRAGRDELLEAAIAEIRRE